MRLTPRNICWADAPVLPTMAKVLAFCAPAGERERARERRSEREAVGDRGWTMVGQA